jgi:hypothetical protein
MWSAGCLIRSHALVRLTACREYVKVRTQRPQQSSTAISAPASSVEANDKRKRSHPVPRSVSDFQPPRSHRVLSGCSSSSSFLPSRGYQHRVGLLQVAVGHARTATRTWNEGWSMPAGLLLPTEIFWLHSTYPPSGEAFRAQKLEK